MKRCRTAKGKFTKCRGGVGGTRRRKSKSKGSSKGRCLKWAKGRTRCLKRAVSKRKSSSRRRRRR